MVFGPHLRSGSSDLTATRTSDATAFTPFAAFVVFTAPFFVFTARFFGDVAVFFDRLPTAMLVDRVPTAFFVPFFLARAVLPVLLRSPVTPVTFLTFATCSPRLCNKRRMISGFFRYRNLGWPATYVNGNTVRFDRS